jgi:hypothetical protein
MNSRRIDPLAIDVAGLVQRSVASLYSSLVTRPTGRAVRYAIESQLAEASQPALSLIDLSEVSLLDFSCADEVVAKLLMRYLGDDRPGEAFFVVAGVRDAHRHAIEVVMERHSLAVVARGQHGGFELIGPRSLGEARVWDLLESRGRIGDHELRHVLPDETDRVALGLLEARRLVFRPGDGEHVHAFSAVLRDLG